MLPKSKPQNFVPKTLEIGAVGVEVGVLQDQIATRVGTDEGPHEPVIPSAEALDVACFTVRGIGGEPKQDANSRSPQTEWSTRRSWVEFSLQPGYLPTLIENTKQ